MTTLTEASRKLYELQAELKAHEAAAQKRAQEIRSQITANSKIIETASEGLDPEKIALAEAVIYVRGSYGRAGTDRASVVSDAIKQLATGKAVREIYSDLWKTYFGTKNYAHWSGQRSDHEYGYGPKHGSVVFEIGLRPDVRSRLPQDLTPEETEAAIYYLTNLQRVQEAEARAKLIATA